jgi:GNAT superfamily N-acetyltransferase
MVQVNFYTELQAFDQRVRPFLLEREAQYNVLLGLLSDIARGRYTEFWMATLEDDGELLGCVLQTPPHPMALTELGPEAIAVLMETLLSHHPRLDGVAGPVRTVDVFGALWQTQTGARTTLDMAQGIYQITEVRFPDKLAAGTMRGITRADFPLLDGWVGGFNAETGLPKLADNRVFLEARLPAPSLFVLEDDGPVSMAGWSGPTPTGVRVNAVYTPPEHRGKGYASAIVARLSQQLLDEGRRFCFLYTDLKNPQSNRIYQRLGYRHVCDGRVIGFGYGG